VAVSQSFGRAAGGGLCCRLRVAPTPAAAAAAAAAVIFPLQGCEGGMKGIERAVRYRRLGRSSKPLVIITMYRLNFSCSRHVLIPRYLSVEYALLPVKLRGQFAEDTVCRCQRMRVYWTDLGALDNATFWLLSMLLSINSSRRSCSSSSCSLLVCLLVTSVAFRK